MVSKIIFYYSLIFLILKNTPKKEKQLLEVIKKFKFNSFSRFQFKTTKLDLYPANELIAEISKFIKTIRPNSIYLPYFGDAHSDHLVVSESFISSAKTFRTPFVKEIFFYETLSETNFSNTLKYRTFQPNLYEDISKYLDKKISICKIYKNELKQHPFPRSIDAIKSLAKLRGSESNCNAAEAFMIFKKINS